MTDRIKLTENDFIPIDSMGSTLIGFGEEYDSEEAQQLKHQILDNQEKAEKLDKVKSFEYNLRNADDANFRPVLHQLRKILNSEEKE